MKKILLFMFSFSIFLFSSCGEFTYLSNDWKNIGDEMSFKDWNFNIDNVDGSIEVIKVDPDNFKISVKNLETPKRINELDFGANFIVINGSYFHEDYTPSGFLMIDGKRVGDRMFDQQKSAMMSISDNHFRISDLQDEPIIDTDVFDYALQSFPLLIKDGKGFIKENSGKKSRRTAIGNDKQGNIYIFVSDSYLLSLYEFMEEILKMDIEIDEVINLDGGTSTGLKVQYLGYKNLVDNLALVPNVILFEKK